MLKRLVVIVSCLLFGACAESVPDYPKREPPAGLMTEAGATEAGRQLFREHCAFCHGLVSEGRTVRANDYQPPPMDFREHRYLEMDPAYLYWRIEVGKNVEPYRSQGSVMPAWKAHLTGEQIWQLVAYLVSRAT